MAKRPRPSKVADLASGDKSAGPASAAFAPAPADVVAGIKQRIAGLAAADASHARPAMSRATGGAADDDGTDNAGIDNYVADDDASVNDTMNQDIMDHDAIDNIPATSAEPTPTSPPTPAPGAGVTPSMAQFIEIKAANPDCLLFYRMGDFYEIFFEDAVAASQALGIVLTKRGKHLGEDIPMCGVPVHRADEYLQRLIKRGFRVAVCEQMEDPAEARKRGSKAVVRRDVVRLVTPGTLTEDALLDAKTANFLTALFRPAKSTSGDAPPHALASLDISTGAFEVGEFKDADLAGELVRLSPSEILAADATTADLGVRQIAKFTGAALTPVPSAYFDSMAGERDLKARLGVADLAGFGSFSRAELAATGALLKYVELTQLGKKGVLRPPRRSGAGAILVIDAASRASLEIVRSSSGDKQGSLLSAIDRTVTGPGARELAARLSSPLRNAKQIADRLDIVGYLLEAEHTRTDLRQALRAAPDIARAVSRLAFGRGGPRDLTTVRDGLGAAADCARLIAGSRGVMGLPAELEAIAARLDQSGLALRDTLARALVEEPPHLRRDGGFVRAGFRADLDENRKLRDDSRKVMAALEAKYQEATQIKSLKVRHNNILGFYIEVSAGTAKPMMSPPLDQTFKHRQTMASAMRFTTAELVEIEGRISSSADRALAIEQEVFADLAAEVGRKDAQLGAIAEALAELDHYAGLAEIAFEEAYIRPLLDEGTAFEIRGGRHPVVEQALKADKAAAFIDNDCVLGRATPHGPGMEDGEDARIWLVTGPNMAGKSTFLRQNALITLMAQMGSFVPARSAHIGIVDRLFSRVGASDDLARGRSTFMVEMVETAGILNQASDRSLVILDEIGRGTATFDGLSIAWATVEYLHGVCKSRALFATHFHELTVLQKKLAGIANVTIDVREWQDEIVFLHKVKPGAADRSYGIQVAKLAGLPAAVISRAGEVLALLEKSGAKPSAAELIDDLPLFAAARPKSHLSASAATSGPHPLATALEAINPDELTPKAALEALYKLKELLAAHAKTTR